MQFTLTLKAFPCSIGVYCGEWDKEKVERFANILRGKDKHLDSPKDCERALCYSLSMNCLIWLPDEPSDAEGVSDLAHEAFHAAEHVAKKIGVKHSDDSSEFYAYIIGYVVKETLNRCGKGVDKRLETGSSA